MYSRNGLQFWVKKWHRRILDFKQQFSYFSQTQISKPLWLLRRRRNGIWTQISSIINTERSQIKFWLSSCEYEYSRSPKKFPKLLLRRKVGKSARVKNAFYGVFFSAYFFNRANDLAKTRNFPVGLADEWLALRWVTRKVWLKFGVARQL